MEKILTVEDLKKEVKNSEKVETDNIQQEQFEASISQDGRHLLCRLPKNLIDSFNILEDIEDKGEIKSTKKLKDRLTKNWKIVFSNLNYEKNSGTFTIEEK